MNGTTATLVGIALSVLLLVYPFNVTVSPEWDVKVVDENGKPLRGAYVEEFANYRTLDMDHHEAVCSDSAGKAHFPRRTVAASVVTRVSRWISKFGPHSSLGLEVEIIADRLGYGDMPDQKASATWNGGPNRVDSQLVLHNCPNGFTGYACNFRYDYFFSVNSSAREIAGCASGP